MNCVETCVRLENIEKGTAFFMYIALKQTTTKVQNQCILRLCALAFETSLLLANFDFSDASLLKRGFGKIKFSFTSTQYRCFSLFQLKHFSYRLIAKKEKSEDKLRKKRADMGALIWRLGLFSLSLLFTSDLTTATILRDEGHQEISYQFNTQLDSVPIVNPTTPSTASPYPTLNPTTPQSPYTTRQSPPTPTTTTPPTYMTPTNPTTSPNTNPNNSPSITPTTMPTSPNTNTNPTTPTSPAISGVQWCIASASAQDKALKVALDYACGYGADCSAIQPGAIVHLEEQQHLQTRIQLGHILSIGQLSNIIGIPTSKRTKEQACFLGIPLSASKPSDRAWKQPPTVSFTTAKSQLRFATIRASAAENKVEAAAPMAEKEEGPMGWRRYNETGSEPTKACKERAVPCLWFSFRNCLRKEWWSTSNGNCHYSSSKSSSMSPPTSYGSPPNGMMSPTTAGGSTMTPTAPGGTTMTPSTPSMTIPDGASVYGPTGSPSKATPLSQSFMLLFVSVFGYQWAIHLM
ncbi:hypothetical protein Ahy_A03g013480 [Arachis hypogaea]|uniref:X8 domain-containing protein n=1 Tax=Arachis hypogaea TaxID=3818 RepID=A0A445DVI4_ARAHY|nr:hypothetical protein Ahy_A03g013480 [Arachis hypogaea]